MSTDSSIKLRLENVDIDLFSSFLGINTPINYDGCLVWDMFSVDLFLSIEKNSPPQLLSNYDKSGKWGIYIMICCEWYRYYSDVGHMTGLTIAKYIFNHFKSDSFFDDENGLEQTFFYGEKGLILLNTSIFAKKNYPFPDGTLYDFSDLYLKYGNLENKNKTFNSKLDIVVHIPLDSVLSGELHWSDSAKNKSHPWLNTLPPKDEYIVDAFFRGPIKTIIQKGAWQYSGKFVDKPVISMSYISPIEWRDVVIRGIIGDCACQYFDTKYLLVTTGDGEIMFIFKDGQFIIDKRWQDYFSKPPLGEDGYTVDDNLIIRVGGK